MIILMIAMIIQVAFIVYYMLSALSILLFTLHNNLILKMRKLRTREIK